MSTQLSRKERGLCSSCKNPPREGKTLCQSCADKRRDRVRARRAEGYCIKTGCWNKTSGASRCPECTEKRSRYNKKIADSAREAGLCPECGGEREDNSYKMCATCRKRVLTRVQKRSCGGNRSAVIQRDNEECQVCCKKGKAVHHIDGSGKGGGSGLPENNKLENLILLCSKCHVDIHKIGNQSSRSLGASLVVHPGNMEDVKEHPRTSGWYQRREHVLDRDGRTCQLCGDRKRRQVVHHKNDKGLRSARPDNREENLITLCLACHGSITNFRNNGQRQLASKLIYALGPGTTGQQLTRPA